MFHPFTGVAHDTVGDSDVSTLFTIYGDNSVSPPLVYLVVIDGGERDGYKQGYATESEALAAHAVIVERLRRDQAPTA